MKLMLFFYEINVAQQQKLRSSFMLCFRFGKLCLPTSIKVIMWTTLTAISWIFSLVFHPSMTNSFVIIFRERYYCSNVNWRKICFWVDL